MMTRTAVVLFAAFLSAPNLLYAQTYAPVVTMRVTTPDGSTQEISARESAVATVTLKDGTVYEFRPTIHDEPFSKVTVSIFKAATSTEPTAGVGDVHATNGGPAVDAKSKPNFKIAILNIEGAQSKTSS
jgi:hypothetical protein